jgi:uncharacterized protein YjbI with pentapeptide repeats
MANPVHEALLRQSVEDWNEWRAENPGVRPDLSELAMSAANLRGANLSNVQLCRAKLIRTRLEGSDLRFADLRDTQMHEADLTDADLSRANLDGAQLAGAKLRRARLVGASMRRAQITVSDLRESDLSEADLEGADLRESVGTNATLERANLTGAEFSGCRLTECNLTGALGLTRRQLESAIADETTVLSEAGTTRDTHDSLNALLNAIEAIRAQTTGTAVSETLVSHYHALLSKLDSRGFQTEGARIGDEELQRPVTSWDRTSGGEAFELSPTRSMNADRFHQKLDRVLEDIRRHLL